MRLNDFLTNELDIQPISAPRKTLIMDNARPHHNSNMLSICQSKNLNLSSIPAYSPQLNPIEQFFSLVKANYKRSQMPKNNFQEIKLAIEDSINQIDEEYFSSIYREMRRWVERAISGQIFI